MKTIEMVESCSYAHEGKPHLPQVHLVKGEAYEVNNKPLTSSIANKAVARGYAKFIETISEPVIEDFDPSAASLDEMIAFVEADVDISELIDTRLEEEELRQELVSLLKGD